MKMITSKHTYHGKKHHGIISLSTIALLLWGLLIPLSLPCYFAGSGQIPLFHAVSAEASAEGSSLSEAVCLPAGTRFRVSLPPCSHKYYYINSQKDCCLTLLSGSSSVKITFYTDSGRILKVPRINQVYYPAKVAGKANSPGKRIFLKFSSRTARPCSIKVIYQKSPKKHSKQKKQPTPRPIKQSDSKKTKTSGKPTPPANIPATKRPMPKKSATSSPAAKRPMPKKSATSSPATGKPTPAAAQNPGTPPASLCISPHFIRLTPGGTKEFSLTLGNTPVKLADCTYFITDSSIVTVKNNTLTGEKPGTAILYFKDKRSAACGSSLIRVI